MSYVRRQKRQFKRDLQNPVKRDKIVQHQAKKVRRQMKKDKRFEIIVTSCFMFVLIVVISLKLWGIL